MDMIKRGIKFIYTNQFGESIEFSDDSQIYITEIDGLSLNDINITDTSVTSQVGSTITNQSIQPKILTFDGIFAFNKNIRKQMLSVVLPGVTATLRYINEFENIDVYWEGAPKKTPIIDWNNSYQNFQFTFYAPFPYARDSIQNTTDFNTLISRHRFKRSYSSTVKFKLSDRSYNPLKKIINQGVLSSGFKLYMKAMADNIQAPNLINVDTQEMIRFSNLTLNNGDEIEVSTYINERYCRLTKKGVVSNIFADMDYDSVFFQLKPGENVVRFGADTNEKNLETRIEFSNVYAGV